jgi:5-methylcytosine-specific restriction enzyme subunit McrC
MNIPIQNIYYLLCYAWNRLEEKDIVSVSQIDKGRIVDLFSKVLIGGISHLCKKGLDRGYVFYSEETCRIHGKINFTTTLKRHFFTQPALECEFDELSYNVLHNRILKSTIKMLLGCEDVDEAIHDELVFTYRRLHGINEVPLTKKYFRLVQLHRSNFFYDFLLRICELVIDNLLISEKTGKSKFRDFVRDEQQMAYLFEEFVRNFFKMEQSKYKVCRENISWDAFAPDGTSPEFLPKMQTDISLISPSRKIVVDTKYYRSALQTHYDKETIRSNNLYQLFAYLKNLEPRGEENTNCEGILLYPTVETELDEECIIQGHRILFRSINLNQDWKCIHKDLMSIINNS